jgi:hypothetical protein
MLIRPLPARLLRKVFTVATVAGLAAAVAGCAIVINPDENGNGKARYVDAFGNGSTVKGDGRYTVQTRPVDSVERLEVQGRIQLEVRIGAVTSLQVEADSNLLPLLHTDSAGSHLKVWIDTDVRSSNAVRVILTTPQLADLRVTGSGGVTVSGLNGAPLRMQQNGSGKTLLVGTVGRFDVELNGSGTINATALTSGATVASVAGSGKLELGEVRGDELRVEVNGSGDVRARGAVRAVNVRLNGSGDADLIGLRSQQGDLRTRGSGDVSVAVSDAVVAQSNGSGRITVYGNPARREISGQRVSIVQ